MIKILSISHVPWDAVYGAGTSLRLHWKVLEQEIIAGKITVSIISRVGLIGYILSFFRPNANLVNMNNLGPMIFALDQNYDYDHFSGGVFNKIRKIISRSVNIVFEYFTLAQLIIICKQNNYDVIHANSHVLISIIVKLNIILGKKRPKLIVHVRDILSNELSLREKKYFMHADLFVCIDFATREKLIEVLGDSYVKKSIILQNPFISSPLGVKFDFRKYNISDDLSIYAIVGAIIPEKGVLRACKAFIHANLSNAVMVVVGNGDDLKELKKICDSSNGRVVYLGEISNLTNTGFFNSIDYLVRADSTFRTGRTVFEALYSAKMVILPGDIDDLELDENLSKFRSSIFLYNPLFEEELISVYIETSKNIVNFQSISSIFSKDNFQNYRKQIMRIYGYNSCA